MNEELQKIYNDVKTNALKAEVKTETEYEKIGLPKKISTLLTKNGVKLEDLLALDDTQLKLFLSNILKVGSQRQNMITKVIAEYRKPRPKKPTGN